MTRTHVFQVVGVTIFRPEGQSLFGSCFAFRGQITAIFVPFLDDTYPPS